MRFEVFLALAILGGVAVQCAPRRQSPALAAFGSRTGKREVSRIKRTRSNTGRRFRKRFQRRMLDTVPLEVFDQAYTLTSTSAPEVVQSPATVVPKEVQSTAVPKKVIPSAAASNEIVVPVEKKEPMRFIPMVELEQQQSYSQIWQRATNFLARNPYFLHWLASLGEQTLRPATSQQEKIELANAQLRVIQDKKVNLNEILTSSDNQPKSLFIKTDIFPEENVNQITDDHKSKSLAKFETVAETYEEILPTIPLIELPVAEAPIEEDKISEVALPVEEKIVEVEPVPLPEVIATKEEVWDVAPKVETEYVAFDSLPDKAPQADLKQIVDLIAESQVPEGNIMDAQTEEKVDLIQEKLPIIEEIVETSATDSPLLLEVQPEKTEIIIPAILEEAKISKVSEPSETPTMPETIKVLDIPQIPKIPEIPQIPQIPPIPILRIIQNIRKIPEMFNIPKSIDLHKFQKPIVTTDMPKTTEEPKLVTDAPVTQESIQERVEATTILAEIKQVEQILPIKQELAPVAVTPKTESESPLPVEVSSSTALPQIEESTTEVIPEEKLPTIIPEIDMVKEEPSAKKTITNEAIDTLIRKSEIPEAKPILIKKKKVVPIKVKPLVKKIAIQKLISKPAQPKVAEWQPIHQEKTSKSLLPDTFESAFSLTPFKFPSFSYSIRHIPNHRNYFGRR